MDLDASIAGAETERLDATACGPGGGVSLWTIAGGGHVPKPTKAAVELLVGELLRLVR